MISQSECLLEIVLRQGLLLVSDTRFCFVIKSFLNYLSYDNNLVRLRSETSTFSFSQIKFMVKNLLYMYTFLVV